MDTYFTGRVKWFGTKNESFGYIFIDRSCGGGEVFVHYSGIVHEDPNTKYRRLVQGQRVQGMLVDGKNGIGSQAVEVRVIQDVQSNRVNGSKQDNPSVDQVGTLGQPE